MDKNIKINTYERGMRKRKYLLDLLSKRLNGAATAFCPHILYWRQTVWKRERGRGRGRESEGGERKRKKERTV